MDTQYTAYISNKKDIISVLFKNTLIRFRGPYSLVKINRVKEWDNGYIVLDVNYSYCDESVEDYIDLQPILCDLYIDDVEFLKPIKQMEVADV